MIEPENRQCEVCLRVRDVWVASGSLGAYSIARCRECLEQYAEPIWAVQGTIMMSGGRKEAFCEEFFEMITWHPRRKCYVKIGELNWKPSSSTSAV